MIYDGVDLSRYMLVSCPRPLLAPPKISSVALAGRDGFEVSSVTLESFSVEARCWIFDKSELNPGGKPMTTDEVKRVVAALLFRREKRPLVFNDDPTRYCMAIVSDVSDVERRGRVDICTVTFLCEPFFYSPERKVEVGGRCGLIVGGTMPTSPLFHITSSGSCQSIRVTNEVTGEFVQVNAAFASGTRLVIDMAARRAEINGTAARVTITSDFFQLAPGAAEVSLSSGAGTMAYREVWL